MIKDHLDNVRMVLTEEVKQDVYPAATLEEVTHNGGTAISKEDDFYTITEANVVYKSAADGIPDYENNNGNPPYNNNPYSNYTANSNRVYKLNATTNTNSNKTGLGVVLKVMAGDNVNIFGKSYPLLSVMFLLKERNDSVDWKTERIKKDEGLCFVCNEASAP